MLLLHVAKNGYSQRVYADAQTHTSTPLLASVSNPGNAVDSDISNFSTLNVLIGAFGAVGTAEQNLQFTGIEKPGPRSPITVKFTAINNTLSVLNLLGAVSFVTTNNQDPVGTVYSGRALLDLLGLFSSGQVVEATFNGPKVTYDGIRMKLSTILGIGPSARYYYAFFIVAPTISSVEICLGDTDPIPISNFQPGYTYKVYNSEIGGDEQLTMETNVSTIPLPANLGVGVHEYWLEARENNLYPSARTKFTVTIYPKPRNPNLSISNIKD